MTNFLGQSSIYTISALETDDKDLQFARNKIIKNLLVVSLAWWIFYSIYDCLFFLQSTLNSDDGIGVISSATQSGSSCVVALLFSKYFIKKIGCKRVMQLALLCHIPYIASNFYPHWGVMIPSSLLAGAANAVLWSSLYVYLNTLSQLYADHIRTSTDKNMFDRVDTKVRCNSRPNDDEPKNSNNIGMEKVDVSNTLPKQKNSASNESQLNLSSEECKSAKIVEGITAWFFGLHGMMYHTCHIVGNASMYFILQIGNDQDVYVTNSTCVCGADFCNDQTECFDDNLKEPSDEVRYTLTAFGIIFAIISVIVITFFLDELMKIEKNVLLSIKLLMASCKLWKCWNMAFLIPMAFYVGLLHGFIMGDYTQAYVGCAWGFLNITLVNAMYGFGFALSASVCGWCVKLLGRPPVFLSIAALNVVTAVLLLLWRPDGQEPAMLFVVGGLLGFILGAYWTQSRAFYGVLFKGEEEAAFGSYQVLYCLGAFVAFGYSRYLCTSIKIYFSLCFLR